MLQRKKIMTVKIETLPNGSKVFHADLGDMPLEEVKKFFETIEKETREPNDSSR